jgi:uncharacterized protein YcfJ
MLVGFTAAALTVASAGAFAQDRNNDRNDDRYDSQYDDRYDNRNGNDESDGYDYARVVDVQPLTTRVRVSVPQRECWDETRYDDRGYNNGPNSRAGSTLLGAAIGAVIGHQIGHGDGRRAATVGGAVIGAAIGGNQADRRNSRYGAPPPREYTTQRCETRYRDSYEERNDGYRVTYIYNGRRQVTTLPYRPGDRIRVRVDVSPAE